MAGYLDTRKMIIDTLMGRPEGTQIQPEDHQAYALNLLNYVRAVELSSASSLIGIAEANTVPIEPYNARVSYVTSVPQNTVRTFTYFKKQNNEPITITTEDFAVFVILLWNTQYWEYQLLPVTVIKNDSFVGYFECASLSTDVNKTISSEINQLTANLRILVKMNNINTQDNATFQIGLTQSKPLFYNGSRASSTNTWNNGDVLDIYFDGVNYQANDNVFLFKSGERLKDVFIDNTHLVNPADGSLPKAEDVMQLKAKLEGVTASEVKVTQQPITGSYVKGADGTIGASTNAAYIEVPLNDVKSVRFLGALFASSSYTSGYAFGHYTDEGDPTTWVTDKSSVFDANASIAGTKEYIIAAPEVSTHFRTTTATSVVPALSQNFYCYLQSGEGVIDITTNIVNSTVRTLSETIYGTQDREIGDNILSSFIAGKGAFTYTTPIIVDNVEYSYESKNISGMQSVTLNISSYKDGNHKIYIKGNSSRNTRYTWMKVSTRPTGYKTFDELQEETLSYVHTQYASFSLDYEEEVELDIPEDAVVLFFTRNVYSVDSNSTNRLPQEVRIVTYTKTSDGDLDKTNKKLDEEIEKFSDYVADNLTFNQLNIYGQDSFSYYIQTNGVVNSNSTYKHILVPTKEGEYVKVVRNETYYAYIAFLTDTLTSGSAAPFVEGTGLYIISDNKEHIYEVPKGTKYLYIYKWQNSGKVYYPKYIAITDNTNLPDIVVQNDYHETKRIIEQLTSLTRSEEDIINPNFKPLLLLHYSDLHGQIVNQDRINDFRGVFEHYLDDTIQTGDILLTRFNNNLPFGDISTTEAIAENPSRNILSVIGNHDTNGTDSQDNWHQNQGLPVYNKLIAPFVQYWNVTQPTGAAENGYCFYYKDYPESRVRLIVLDTFCTDTAYNEVQLSWFESTLNSAMENGLSVIVASHFRIKSNELIKSSFTCLNAAVENPDTSGANDPYIPYVDTFIQSGGDFICWLTGHAHYDAISKRNNPLQINVCVGNASRYYNTNYNLYITNSMISSSPNDYKTFDLFNLVAVDTRYKLLTLVRIGSNWDKYGRYKKTTCINYNTGELIY